MPSRPSLALACLMVVFACIGCSKPAAPSRPPAPPFVMPAGGDATDTILHIGEKMPEIQTVDLDGNDVTLNKELFGKRCTLIVFWSTWCGFCMKELPHEVELANQYEDAGLRVIGINADDTTEIAKAAAKKNKIPWLNLFEGPDKTISNQLGVLQWPTLILLDSAGNVITSTQQLRSIAAEVLPDGSVRTVNGLDWALKELLGGKNRLIAPL